MYDALSVLGGRALFEGEERQVHVRIAEVDGAIYLDLANGQWEAVRVTASDWAIISDPPVKFRRPRGMLALPRPAQAGDISRLRPLLNLGSDDDWALYLGCLVQAMRGSGPYPILLINGEHGSAKSSATQAFRDLVDPRDAGLRTVPRDERDLMIQASNSWIIAFDNLSYLPKWFPDALCRLSTGGGMGTRELFSDDEEVLFKGRRPIVINGIEEIVTAPDMADRAVLLVLPKIQKRDRNTEEEFQRDFASAHPVILGGLLDAVVVGLKNRPTLHLDSLPRMADYAKWVIAAEPGPGLPSGSFLTAYDENREGANESTLEASPIVPYLRELLVACHGEWKGRPSELLAELETRASERDRKLNSWPKQANILSNRLRVLGPNLRDAGIEVEFGRDKTKREVIIKNTM